MRRAKGGAPRTTETASGGAAIGGADLFLYSIVVLAWGTSWIGLKWQTGVVAPEVSVLWRILLSCPLMFLWAAAAGQRLMFPLRDHVVFAAMGASMFSLNYALFYTASITIPSGLLAVVFSLASLYNVLLGWLFFAQRIDPRVVLAGVVGFAGLGLMFAHEIIEQQFDAGVAMALVLCVVATALFCLGNIASAHSQRRGQSVLAGSAWGMVYGSVILLVVSLVRGHAFEVEWTVRYLGSLVWLAVTASVIAFWAFLTLVGRAGAARAGYVTVLFPVVALILSTFLENYRWTLLSAAGLVLVLIGNLLILRAQPSKPRS